MKNIFSHNQLFLQDADPPQKSLVAKDAWKGNVLWCLFYLLPRSAGWNLAENMLHLFHKQPEK